MDSTNVQDNRKAVICGTGHRPDKLGGYGVEVKNKLLILARDFLSSRELYGKEYKTTRVISGGALGWDTAIAQAALSLNIPLTLALPFPGYEDRWPESSKMELYAMQHQADVVQYICKEGYAGWKMQKRNEWMVDNCDLVLALWDGSSGGTGNCIAYANKVRKPIINLWESYK